MALTYRDVNANDRPQITEWVAADEAHQGTDATFWMNTDDDKKTKKGVKCIAIEDEAGVVFYARLDNVVRVRMQFPPHADVERTTKALREGFAYVGAGAKASGYIDMIFDTVSAGLIRATRKLGFKALRDTFQIHL